MGRRKKEEGRRKKEEGRRKKEEGRILVTRLCLGTQIRRLCLQFSSVSNRGRAYGHRFPGRA